jgi:predicted AlkP superfamily pyrophosphatase or phosphodiesterase
MKLSVPLALLMSCTLVASAEPSKPKLVVLVVFDQMRGDYLSKWAPLFGTDGFARMQSQGAWFENCHYPYAITTTGPGHASMLTGATPSVHGIVNNTWYEPKLAATVNCVQSNRYQRVPPAPKPDPKLAPKTVPEEKKDEENKALGTPERLLAPTFGDALKGATGGKGRVVGLSFKDRGSILPTGARADAAYWLDGVDGMIVTSTFFRDAVHPWVSAMNLSRVADRWFDKPWNRFDKRLNYATFSGPDDVAGEGKGARQGVIFPHPTDGGSKTLGKGYYEALYNSPYGNEFLLEMAKAAVVAEKLGQDDVPDLLTISFSSNDSIGHCWGPDSQEVLDVTLRSDRIMADLLKFLDLQVGEGKYLLCLTADHGICPLPEVSAARGFDARRLPLKKLMSDTEEFLRSRYDTGVPGASKSKWIVNGSYPWIHLNHKLIESKQLTVAEVSASVSEFLNYQLGIERVFTRAQLESSSAADADDPILAKVKLSHHPERCGDLTFLMKPYWLPGDEKSTGTTHGSPYEYDTHVPLLVFGANVRPGTREARVAPQSIATIFANALGIPRPAKAMFPAPERLFE